MSIELPKNGRVLLVEDQLIIAMDAEFILSEHGFATVDTATTVAEALALIRQSAPHAAILDFSLGSETSLRVAEELLARKIPFVFATGYNDRSMVPASLAHVPVVGKPYDAADLIDTLTRAIAEASSAPDTK